MKSKGSALQIVVILWSIFISFFMIFMSSNGYRYQLLHNIDNVMKQKNIEIFLTKYYIETMKEDFLLSDTFTGENYEIDLVLRNNITTEEHPLGVYHPHAKLHNIKKENIGLIEVMGLAILPARLKQEMEVLADAILTGKDIRSIEILEKHADWAEEFLPKYDNITADNVMDIIHDEIGKVFSEVLEDAGVYKRDEAGQKAFMKFIQSI